MEKIIICPFTLNNIINYHRLNKIGKNIVGFFDNNVYLHGKKYGNVKIEIPRFVSDTKVVVCSEKHYDVIKKQLQNIGYTQDNIKKIDDLEISNIDKNDIVKNLDLESIYKLLGDGDAGTYVKAKKMVYFSKLLPSVSFQEIEGPSRKEIVNDIWGKKHIVLKRLELDLTSRCTLRCKNCCNMMQYFEHPSDIDSDTVIKDYNRIMELIDWTDDIMLIGGETFLYRDLAKIVKAIFQNKLTLQKVGMVRVLTNGTVLPSQETLKELARHNLIVEISNYGEKSKKIDELIDYLNSYGIKYTVLDIKWWSYVQQYAPASQSKTNEQLLELRKSGCVTLCRVVDQGKFYLCCNLKSLILLDALPKHARDCYINIYDEDAKGEIIQYLNHENMMPKACSWCTGCSLEDWNNSRIPVAEQSKKVLPYRKYEE